MTSYLARYGTFSPEFRALRRSFGPGNRPRTLDEKLLFYFHYLSDVAPRGIRVSHAPSPGSVRREEIQLVTRSGFLFMTGLVGMDINPQPIEELTADEAYSKWHDGQFIDDGDQFRFFTAISQLLFYGCIGEGEWQMLLHCHPIDDAEEVAAFLQWHYDILEHH